MVLNPPDWALSASQIAQIHNEVLSYINMHNCVWWILIAPAASSKTESKDINGPLKLQ